MKKLSVVCIVLCVGVSTPVAFAHGGGMGSHHSSVTGGDSGASPPRLVPTRWARRFHHLAPATQ